jgi:hypothetical protein
MRLLLLTGPLALSVAAALLAPATPARGDPPPMSDVILARAVLAAVDADPQFKDVNLVVSVVNRVAVIGGPVASADVGKRAEAAVRKVTGVAEVKNHCYVEARPDPFLKAVAERVGAAPRPLLADLPPVVPPPRTGTPAAAVPPETALAAASPVETEVVAQKPATLAGGPTGFLGSPTAPATTSAMKPPAVLTSLPAKGSDLRASVEAVRRADRRYAALAVEPKNGTLVIGGTAPRLADAWDLAQALRQLPGVSRVVVGTVGVK